MKQGDNTNHVTSDITLYGNDSAVSNVKKNNKRDNILLWFFKNYKAHRISAYATQVTFFIIVSFFPFSMFLITLLGCTPIEQDVLLRALTDIVPDSLFPLLKGWISESYATSGTFLSITVITTLWAGSQGFSYLAIGLEDIYRTKSKHNFLVRRLIALWSTVLFSVIIIVSLALLVYGNQIVQIITRHFPAVTNLHVLAFLGRSVVALILLTIYFTFFYHFVPKNHGSILFDIPGAILAAVFWIVFSYLFSLYVDARPNIGSVYGSLTSMVLLMLWLLCCVVFLFIGALLNKYILTHSRFSLITSIKESPSLIRLFFENRK